MTVWMLLAVFVPMLILSSIHVHENSNVFVDECNECVQHHCHGHLVQQTVSMHDCVLCQFLSLTTLAATVVTLVLFNNVGKIRIAQRQLYVYSDACGIPTLRAPPAV